MRTTLTAAKVCDQARADAPSKCAACGGENLPGACCCYKCFTSGNVSCGPPPGVAAEDGQEMTQPVSFAPGPALNVNKTGSAGSLEVLAEAAARCFTRDVQETVRQLPERPPDAGTTLLRPQPSVYVAPSRTAAAAQGLAQTDIHETAARPTLCCRLPCKPDSQPSVEKFVPVQERPGCYPHLHAELGQPAGDAAAVLLQPDGNHLPADPTAWASHEPSWAPYLMGIVAAAQLGAQVFQPLGQASQSCPTSLTREQIHAGLASAALGLAASAFQPISEPATSFQQLPAEQRPTQPWDLASLPLNRGSQAAQQDRDGQATDVAWNTPTARWVSLRSEPASQAPSAFKTLNNPRQCGPRPTLARASGEIVMPAQYGGELQPPTPVTGAGNCVPGCQLKPSACCPPPNAFQAWGTQAAPACHSNPSSCCQPTSGAQHTGQPAVETAQTCGRVQQAGQSDLAPSTVFKPEPARLPQLLKRSHLVFARECLAAEGAMQQAGCDERQEDRPKDSRANSAESSETTCGAAASSQLQPGEGAEQGSKETKTCTRCHKTLPAASFCKNRRSPDGLFTQCRACVAIKDKARHAKILAQPKAPAGCKVCSRCRERKGQGDFYLDAGRPDGLQTYCKLCYAEKYREKKRQKAMQKGA